MRISQSYNGTILHDQLHLNLTSVCMNDDTMWRLLSRKLAGEASEEDTDELNRYLIEHPNMLPVVRMVSSYWNLERLTEENNLD